MSETMSNTATASKRIGEEVTSWDDVTAGWGSRGEYAFKVAGREIGHLHGDGAAHFFFEPLVWKELREAGRIGPHPVFPHRIGPAARRIADETDVADVIALMRINYDRARSRLAQGGGGEPSSRATGVAKRNAL